MIRFLWLVLPFVFIAPSFADPVYIVCPTNTGRFNRISLDESSATATGLVEGAAALQYYRAMYSPSQVVLIPSSGVGSRWTIDRTTLQASEELYVRGIIKPWRTWQCAKEEVPAGRAF
jgi:hypothetical protein